MEDDGLFDQSRIEDEPFDALPPPRSPGEDNADPFGDDENGEVSKLAEVPEAKRKGVKRPQPKLDSNRLTSERGLPALRTLFNDIKFKGKGHEAEDLRLLMKRMENWAHRLFPKLQFEDFIDKVERLGAKKEVQTCLKRIRLDMPLTHEDYTTQAGEEEVPAEMQIFGDPDPFAWEHLSASTPRMIHSTPAPSASTAQSEDPPLGSSAPSPPSLTEEQQRRMVENRLKALERRLARQKQQTESQSVESQSTQSEPSESQTGESEPVPMEESTEVPPEPDQSPDQVQDRNKDEDQDPVANSSTRDQDQDPVTNSSTRDQDQDPDQDPVTNSSTRDQDQDPVTNSSTRDQDQNQDQDPMANSSTRDQDQDPVTNSSTRDQDQDQDPVTNSSTRDQDQDQDPVTNSIEQPQKPPQTQDSEDHVKSTPDPKEPEASPSPVPEPEENREDEGQDAKEEE